MSLENISCQKSFGGWHKRYRHRSSSLNCDMVFAVYLPPQAEQGEKLPVLYWLSGLTCTDENFMQKAGAHRLAAELGLQNDDDSLNDRPLVEILRDFDALLTTPSTTMLEGMLCDLPTGRKTRSQ